MHSSSFFGHHLWKTSGEKSRIASKVLSSFVQKKRAEKETCENGNNNKEMLTKKFEFAAHFAEYRSWVEPEKPPTMCANLVVLPLRSTRQVDRICSTGLRAGWLDWVRNAGWWRIELVMGKMNALGTPNRDRKVSSGNTDTFSMVSKSRQGGPAEGELRGIRRKSSICSSSRSCKLCTAALASASSIVYFADAELWSRRKGNETEQCTRESKYSRKEEEEVEAHQAVWSEG